MKQRIIELSYNNHEEMFNLPINPSEFEFSEAQNNQKITLLNIGEVNLIGHRGLVTGSLSSWRSGKPAHSPSASSSATATSIWP